MSPEQLLESGLEKLDLATVDGLSKNLLTFAAELSKWNRVYNLTAIKSMDDIVVQHFLDSLSVAPFISAETVIDVGTGGGFPGIPLALVHPDTQFTLLDSNVKKTRFLQQMIIHLGLTNCTVAHSRSEGCAATFGQVVCRAFASLPNIIEYAGHLVADNGQLLAMKGQPGEIGEEVRVIESAGTGFELENILPLAVPHLEGERHLVVFVRNPE